MTTDIAPPTPGADTGVWGDKLNAFLAAVDKRDGHDVREYGTGVGTGDTGIDTAAIQAAVADAGTDPVLFPKPQSYAYLVDPAATIEVPAGFHWKGEGGGGSEGIQFDWEASPVIQKNSGTTPLVERAGTSGFPENGGVIEGLGLVAPRTAMKLSSIAGFRAHNVGMRATYDGTADNAALLVVSSFWCDYDVFAFDLVGAPAPGGWPAVILRGATVPDGITKTYLQNFARGVFGGGHVRYEQNVALGGPVAELPQFGRSLVWENTVCLLEALNNTGSLQQLVGTRLDHTQCADAAGGSWANYKGSFVASALWGDGVKGITDMVLDHADQVSAWPWINSASDIDNLRIYSNSGYNNTLNRGAGVMRQYRWDRDEHLLGVSIQSVDDGANPSTPFSAGDQFGNILTASASHTRNFGGGYPMIVVGGQRILTGTGAPVTGRGEANGDLYIRADGTIGAATLFYHYDGAAWHH